MPRRPSDGATDGTKPRLDLRDGRVPTRGGVDVAVDREAARADGSREPQFKRSTARAVPIAATEWPSEAR